MFSKFSWFESQNSQNPNCIFVKLNESRDIKQNSNNLLNRL